MTNVTLWCWTGLLLAILLLSVTGCATPSCSVSVIPEPDPVPIPEYRGTTNGELVEHCRAVQDALTRCNGR